MNADLGWSRVEVADGLGAFAEASIAKGTCFVCPESFCLRIANQPFEQARSPLGSSHAESPRGAGKAGRLRVAGHDIFLWFVFQLQQQLQLCFHCRRRRRR